MPFWTYMLHCRDRTFYVGHTDDLEVRIAQHQQGTFGGYTAGKRPVTLVWSAEFPTRYEALEAERRIKGWRKEKKLALIRGDWDLISVLAKGKERPSTSSGQTDEGRELTGTSATEHELVKARRKSPAWPELVEGRPFYLLRHPNTPSQAVGNVQVHLRRGENRLHLRYTVAGDIQALALPPPSPPTRTDELWRHTCFELFLRSSAPGYREFNFSPSARWAAYSFTDYRTGMDALDISPPVIRITGGKVELRVDVALSLPDFPPVSSLNLTAVIEEKSGHKSYWALAHPPEGPPDFHHPACFVLELPPPGSA